MHCNSLGSVGSRVGSDFVDLGRKGMVKGKQVRLSEVGGKPTVKDTRILQRLTAS